MSDENAQQEPTMEEILASIRRIISEDNEEASAPETGLTASPEEAVEDEDELTAEEIMDLTDMLGDAHQEPSEEAVSDAEVEPFVDVLASEDEEVVTEPVVSGLTSNEPAQPPVAVIESEPEMESVKMQDSTAEDLLSDTAAGAAAASFENLARAMPVTEVDGRSLEGMVAEMLRPVLKSWLDQHLPTIVQELVEKEIERVTGRDA